MSLERAFELIARLEAEDIAVLVRGEEVLLKDGPGLSAELLEQLREERDLVSAMLRMLGPGYQVVEGSAGALVPLSMEAFGTECTCAEPRSCSRTKASQRWACSRCAPPGAESERREAV